MPRTKTNELPHPLIRVRNSFQKTVLPVLVLLLVFMFGFTSESKAQAPDVNHPNTLITITKNNSVANGMEENVIKIHLADASGNPVPAGTNIKVNLNGISTTFSTDANGNVFIGYSTLKIGSELIIARLENGDVIKNAEGGNSVTITFVADVPDVSTGSGSYIIMETTGAVANGVSVNSVRVHLEDKYGHLIANQDVVFEIVDGQGQFVGTATVTTNSNGEAIIKIRSSKAGDVRVAAKVNGAYVVNGNPAKVTFVAGVPDVSAGSASFIETVIPKAAANGVAVTRVRAHVADAKGNPVQGQAVDFEKILGVAVLEAGPFVTDANGDAFITLTSTTVGEVSIIAKVDGVQIQKQSPAKVEFVADLPDVSPAGGSYIETVIPKAVANGIAYTRVKVHLVDLNGNPVKDQLVVFYKISGVVTIPAGPFMTDANGDVFVNLTSVTAGKVQMSADVNGQTIVNKNPAEVEFIADVPDVTPAGGTYIEAVIVKALANGTAVTKVKVHVVDGKGNPVPGQAVVFDKTGVATMGTGPFITDANGDVFIELTSTQAGIVKVTATVEGKPVVNQSPAEVEFVADIPDVSTAGGSYIEAVIPKATANGTAVTKVKAHVTDANGNPIADQEVVFQIEDGVAAMQVGPFKTDANGDVFVEFTSTKAGLVHVIATINGAKIVKQSPAEVEFVADVPDVSSNSGSFLEVIIPKAAANGAAVTKVRAHVVDVNGNPVANQLVVFEKVSGEADLPAGPFKTDANGDVFIELISTKVGLVQIQAKVEGSLIVKNSPAKVEFVVDAPDVSVTGASYLETVIPKATANGTAITKVKAHVADAKGNAVAGQEVVFSIEKGDGTLQAGVFMTDANGDVEIEITSKKAGLVHVRAEVNGKPILKNAPAIVEFTADVPEVSTGSGSYKRAQTTGSAANGKAKNSVKAHIVDKNGNAVPGVKVKFAITDGEAEFSGAETATTDANGNGLVELTSLKAGKVFLTAFLEDGTEIADDNNVFVEFTWFPDTENPETKLLVVLDGAFADGVAQNSVKAHVVDPNGNALANMSVRFFITSGNADIITAQPVTTDPNGDAIILITSAKPGKVNFGAKVEESSIKNGNPATTTFIAPDIWVPKVFTPNEDGLNDIIKPIITGTFRFEFFSIYNRWGNLLFTSTDVDKGWNGKFKGVSQPNETYLWLIGGLDKDGKKVKRNGMFTLVR